MRAQISLLKEKLDKESIVNDKLMRDAIRQKMGTFCQMLSHSRKARADGWLTAQSEEISE